MADADDPHHPILTQPWQYEIVGFSYHRDLEGWSEPYIDLTLRSAGQLRRLRFFGPQDLRIDEGFPSSSGLCILDVTNRQLEGIGILVDNLEGSGGCPTFWARRVVDLDSDETDHNPVTDLPHIH